MEKTTISENQDLKSHKTIPVEVLVGYDGFYNFEIGSSNEKPLKSIHSLNDWSVEHFYETGKLVANWINEQENANYQIVNGQISQIVYDIPQEEAEKRIKLRCDDPFYSGGEIPHHYKRISCRALLPEQIKVFKSGLEYELQILRGEISIPPKIPPRTDSRDIYIAASAQSNAFAQTIMRQEFSKDITEDYNIKKFKLAEAMITGNLNLNPSK